MSHFFKNDFRWTSNDWSFGFKGRARGSSVVFTKSQMPQKPDTGSSFYSHRGHESRKTERPPAMFPNAFDRTRNRATEPYGHDKPRAKSLALIRHLTYLDATLLALLNRVCLNRTLRMQR